MARFTLLFLIWLVCFQSAMQRSSAKSHSPVVLSETLATSFINEDIPKKCLEQGFCMEAVNYPEELAQKLIRELQELNIVFDNDGNNTKVDPTFRSAGKTRNPCPYKTQTITPFLVRDNVDRNWYYVLNSKKTPIQQYKVQICDSNNTSGSRPTKCNAIILKNGYDSQCIQKSLNGSVVVMNGDDALELRINKSNLAVLDEFVGIVLRNT